MIEYETIGKAELPAGDRGGASSARNRDFEPLHEGVS